MSGRAIVGIISGSEAFGILRVCCSIVFVLPNPQLVAVNRHIKPVKTAKIILFMLTVKFSVELL